jgi:hypothetical protein
MFTTIIIAILCFIFGFFIGKITENSKKVEPQYLRRGISDKVYTLYRDGIKREDVHVQIEVGEIERTNTKSKIVSLNLIFDDSSHNSYGNKEKIKSLMDNSWVESNSIEWIEDNLNDKRNQKIDQILK